MVAASLGLIWWKGEDLPPKTWRKMVSGNRLRAERDFGLWKKGRAEGSTLEVDITA